VALAASSTARLQGWPRQGWPWAGSIPATVRDGRSAARNLTGSRAPALVLTVQLLGAAGRSPTA